MFPYLTLHLGGRDLLISTALVLDGVAILAALTLLPAMFRRSVPMGRSLALVFATAVAVIAGARLFHVFFERPEYFRAHPREIFANYQGMTFYGALILGVPVFLLGLRRLYPRDARARALDIAAVFAAFAYGLLRIGCFAEGCCWGRLCAYPWAVRFFDPHSEMPYLGIPVHPVQLYDAFAGVLIGAILVGFYRKRPALRGRLFGVFLALYAAARFITEFFRGDAYRGVGFPLGLSTSQWISVAIGSGCVLAFGLARRRGNRRRSALAVAAAALSLTGCLPLPRAPGPQVIERIGADPAGYEVYRAPEAPERGLVFVALDQVFQDVFGDELKALYRTDAEVRIEDLTWWVLAPEIARGYSEVIRIDYANFTRESLLAALDAMEGDGHPYDVFLLTHGIPNYLSTTKGHPLLGWEDIDAWKGRFPHLELLFMQSCYGSSLAPDWIAAGAKEVVSYPGLNRNFFYPSTFLRELANAFANGGRVPVRRAYLRANRRALPEVRHSRLDRAIIARMGLGLDEYLAAAPNPEFHAAEEAFRSRGNFASGLNSIHPLAFGAVRP